MDVFEPAQGIYEGQTARPLNDQQSFEQDVRSYSKNNDIVLKMEASSQPNQARDAQTWQPSSDQVDDEEK